MPAIDLYGARLRFELDAGDAGTRQTLAAMWAVIDDAVRSPLVRRVAAHLSTPRDVYDWIVSHVRFKRDPWTVELVRHPEQFVYEISRKGEAAGDCDDVACLGAALLGVLGYAPVLIVVATRPAEDFEHVFFGVFHDGLLTPMDPQERTPIGRLDPRIERLQAYRHPRERGFKPTFEGVPPRLVDSGGTVR